jgi:hypothetical protein
MSKSKPKSGGGYAQQKPGIIGKAIL